MSLSNPIEPIQMSMFNNEGYTGFATHCLRYFMTSADCNKSFHFSLLQEEKKGNVMPLASVKNDTNRCISKHVQSAILERGNLIFQFSTFCNGDYKGF